MPASTTSTVIDSDGIRSVRLASKPFGEGGKVRLAYKAEVTRMDGMKEKYVVKCFRRKYSHFDMGVDKKIHLEAKKWADKFNAEVKPKYPIVFREPLVHVVTNDHFLVDDSGNDIVVEKGEKIMLEPYLPGHFEKFNGNKGYVPSNYINSVPQAFSHYTWHVSQKLIVCDLQGCFQSNGNKYDAYYLTDPAIISTVVCQWGPTDLGMEAIIAFFTTHKCNDMCKGFSKVKVEPESIISTSLHTQFVTKGAKKLMPPKSPKTVVDKKIVPAKSPKTVLAEKKMLPPKSPKAVVGDTKLVPPKLAKAKVAERKPAPPNLRI